MTQGIKTNQGIKSFQVENLKKFARKWKTTLDKNRTASSKNALFERNRKSGMNILFIDHYVSEPDRDSGSLRAFRLLGILSKMNHKITFWPDSLKKSEPYTSELQQKGIEVMYKPINFSKFLDERKNLYDVVILSRPHIAIKYIDQIRKKMPKCVVIFDTVDLHFLRMTRQAKIENSVSESELKKIKNIELSLMTKSDLTIVTSEDEAKFLNSQYPDFKMLLIPNIHIFDGDIPDFKSRKDMMFLGNFQHPPNVDAVLFLLEKIFPKIQKLLPDVHLNIIGPNAPDSIKKFDSSNIHVMGFVKNLEDVFANHRVMLSPLRYGAGVKGKTTQSLTRGVPLITTIIGAEGISLKSEHNCMIADDPQKFADAACKLYNDSKLWKSVSEHGLITSKDFSAENISNTINSLFSKITKY